MLRTVFIALLLIVATPVAFAGSVADWFCYGDDFYTTYDYYLISSIDEDVITSFQVYAPVDVSYIVDYWADEGWGFSATRDDDTGGTILNWFSLMGEDGGVTPGDTLIVSVVTPATIETLEDYVYPGCEGNWSYEVAGWPGSTPIQFSSVAVPYSELTSVTTPEPASIIALMSGLAAITAFRRKRH